MQLRNPRPRKADYRLSALEKRTLLAATVTGSLYNDANANGTKDGGETALTGWTVFLDTNFNNRLDTGEVSTTTDSSGNYSFTNVAAGTAHVAIVTQSGWEETSPSPGRLVVSKQLTSSSPAKLALTEIDPITGVLLHTFDFTQTASGQTGAIGQGIYYEVEPNSSSTATIRLIDLNNGQPISSNTYPISTPSTASSSAYLNGKLYIGYAGSSQVSVWDVTTHAASNLFLSTSIGRGLAGCTDDGNLYAVSNTSKSILVINPSTGATVRTITVANNTFIGGGLAYVNGELLTPGGSTALTLLRIDPTSGAILGTVALGTSSSNVIEIGGDGSAQRTITVAASGSIVAGTFGAAQTSIAPTGISRPTSTTVRVFGTISGATVTLINNTAGTIYTATATGTTTDITVLSVPNAWYQAFQTQPGRLPSLLSPSHYFNVPDVQLPDLASSSDSGWSAFDNITNDNTPTFVGSANDGDTISIFVDSGAPTTATPVNGAYSLTTPALTTSTHNVTLVINGNSATQGVALQIQVVPTTGSEVLRGTPSYTANLPAAVFAFNNSVQGSIEGDDVTIKNLSTNVSTTLPWYDASYSLFTNNTATFPLYNEGFALTDGNYTATLDASKVFDGGGLHLSANGVVNFFYLAGDGNGDRIVNTLDFNALASHYSTAVTNGATSGDFNHDGTVTSADFDMFANNFGKVLAAPADVPNDAPMHLATSAPQTSLFNADQKIESDEVSSVLN